MASLMELPAELRHLIWSYALPFNDRVIFRVGWARDKNIYLRQKKETWPAKRDDLSLFSVNRQLADEVAAFFCEHNTICFDIQDYYRDPIDLNRGLQQRWTGIPGNYAMQSSSMRAAPLETLFSLSREDFTPGLDSKYPFAIDRFAKKIEVLVPTYLWASVDTFKAAKSLIAAVAESFTGAPLDSLVVVIGTDSIRRRPYTKGGRTPLKPSPTLIEDLSQTSLGQKIKEVRVTSAPENSPKWQPGSMVTAATTARYPSNLWADIIDPDSFAQFAVLFEHVAKNGIRLGKAEYGEEQVRKRPRARTKTVVRSKKRYYDPEYDWDNVDLTGISQEPKVLPGL